MSVLVQHEVSRHILYWNVAPISSEARWQYIFLIFEFHSSSVTQAYQHVVALVFAVKEINENAQILTNVTLGFKIYNTYCNARYTYAATMELLSTESRFIPNYKCDLQNNLVAVIGGPNSYEVLHMANILTNYKIAQVSGFHERIIALK